VKILQLHNRYRQRGGEDGVVEAEADLLRSHGQIVEQLFVENPSSHLRAATQLAVSSWNRRSAGEVRAIIDSEDPDLVHVHNSWFVLTAAAVNAASRMRPTVVTLHNYRLACLNGQFQRQGRVCTDCLGRPPFPGVVHACYRDSRPASAAAAIAQLVIRQTGLLDRPDVTVLVHSSFGRDVASQTGIDPERVRIHENFVADPGPRVQAAEKSDEVLFVGRLSAEKGVDLAISAWKRLANDGLRLTVIGDGPEYEALASLAAGTGVQLVGRLSPDQVRKKMIEARCLLVPSRWFESQPLVILEALAAGLPVMATDWPPIRSILESMPRGALVPLHAWDPDIRRLADDDWISSASASARDLYDERFTPDVAYRRLMRIYSDAIGKQLPSEAN
jgi:glycosyltransferase involved in cell wall biosynthesis